MSRLLMVMLIIGMFSCSDSDSQELPEDIQALCNNTLESNLKAQNTPAVVREVEEGQPFFNGIKIYYEVDAEEYFPELFELNQVKMIRIFPVNEPIGEIGDRVRLRGNIFGCITGAHGLVTNDYKGFYLIETPNIYSL